MSELVSSAANAAPRAPQRDSRRNLIAFFGDMGAFNIGMYFMPTTTILVGLASLIFSIMGAMAENQNRPYTYPFSIKIVKK